MIEKVTSVVILGTTEGYFRYMVLIKQSYNNDPEDCDKNYSKEIN